MNRKHVVFLIIATLVAMCSATVFAQATQAPGQEVVGRGYNVFGTYADSRSITSLPLFDFTGMRERADRIGTDLYSVPEIMTLHPIFDHRITTVEGSSVREYARNLSVNAGLEVNALVFKGSVETNINTSDSTTEERFYFTYMDSTILWRISMDTLNVQRLRTLLRPEAAQRINTMDPTALFEAYGTHYIANAYIGARADYNSVSTVTDSVSTADIRVAVEASYKAVSGNTEVTTEQRRALTESNTRTEMRVVGGNSHLVRDIQDYNQYLRWAEGIERRPVLADFDRNSLRPIWELADSPARRAELEAAFRQLAERFPLPPELVNLTALSRQLYMVQNKADGRYWDISGYHNRAGGKESPLQLYRPDRVDQPFEGADRFIKIIPHPVDGDYVFLQPQHGESVIAVEEGSREAGAKMHLWDMVPAHQRGQFKMVPVENERNTFYLQSRLSGLYLEPSVNENRIIQQEFTGSDAQKWVFQATDPNQFMASPARGTFGFQAVAGRGMYFDFPGPYPNVRSNELQVWTGKPNPRAQDRLIELIPVDGSWFVLRPRHHTNLVLSAASGGRVVAVARNNANDQLWRFEYGGEPNVFYVRNRASGQVMDLAAGNVNQDGAPITSAAYTGAENQRWRLVHEPSPWPALHDATFFIRSTHSSKYMDVSGQANENNRNGANVQWWHLNGGEAQAADRRVRFIPVGTQGFFIIEFQNGGRVLDASNNAANEANVQIWQRHGRENQQWRFIPFESNSNFVIQTAVNNRIIYTEGGDINRDGANLKMGNRTNSRGQQFTFVYAEGPAAGNAFEGE